MHYIKTHGRYLGFLVYPGSRVSGHTRAQTPKLMDSLHVTSRRTAASAQVQTTHVAQLPAGRVVRAFTLRERSGVILLNRVTVRGGMRVVVHATIPRV